MSLTLENGSKMPIVGFGLWKVPKESCADTVYTAIKAGVRLLDGACDYGNEVQVGQGIKKAIADGLVKREDLFVTYVARGAMLIAGQNYGTHITQRKT